MAAHYLVDGYNVIHKCRRMRPILNGASLEAARDVLVEQLARFSAASGSPCTVVFDGTGKRHERQMPHQAAPGIDIVFSSGRKSADAYIERRVYQSARRRDLIVVSADSGIRTLCQGLGALVMHADNFLAMLDETLEGARHHLNTTQQRRHLDPLEGRLSADSLERLRNWRHRLEKPKD